MDRSLSGIDFDARLSGGVMRRIENAEGETDNMKRKMAVLLAAALMLVLILAAGAFAAAYFSGSVDWFGNTVPPTLEPGSFSTPVPTGPQEPAGVDLDLWEEMASQKPEDEIWIMEYDNGRGGGRGSLRGIIETVTGLDELRKRVSETNLPFVVPEQPDGYMFKGARLQFFIDEQALKGVTVLGVESPYAGMTLRRFRPDENIRRNIEHCSLWFEDANGNQISLYAWLASTETAFGFGVKEGDTYETVSVPGMEKALYIKRKGIDETLYLMQTGIEPIAYVSPFAINPDYQWGDDTQIFDAVTYDISSTAAQKDVLLSVANSLK